ncbi:MAG: molybdenum cofactor guanylyltransferase [Planctomycetes bacterium]|nr:molybdenum cofactor guanylyltransferase [Planctomycetota bacterium]
MKGPIAAIILTGGKNQTTGKDNTFLPIGNKTVLDILLGKLNPLFPEIIISAKNPARYLDIKGVRVVADMMPAGNDLSGIYSALRYTLNPYAFVISCDTPLVEPGLIKYLLKYRKGFDVVIPESENGFEPFCAVYSKKCVKAMEEIIRKDNCKIIDFLPLVKVKTIKQPEIKKIGNDNFLTLSSGSDYQQIQNKLKTN